MPLVPTLVRQRQATPAFETSLGRGEIPSPKQTQNYKQKVAEWSGISRKRAGRPGCQAGGRARTRATAPSPTHRSSAGVLRTPPPRRAARALSRSPRARAPPLRTSTAESRPQSEDGQREGPPSRSRGARLAGEARVHAGGGEGGGARSPRARRAGTGSAPGEGAEGRRSMGAATLKQPGSWRASDA